MKTFIDNRLPTDNLAPAYEINFSHKIVVYQGHHTILKTLFWKNYTFAQYARWSWYFEYRFALLRVQYPKNRIDNICYKNDLNDSQKKDLLKNKISAKKRKLTIFKSKLFEYKSNWTSMFPIEEDYGYINAIEKINKTELELIELQTLYNSV